MLLKNISKKINIDEQFGPKKESNSVSFDIIPPKEDKNENILLFILENRGYYTKFTGKKTRTDLQKLIPAPYRNDRHLYFYMHSKYGLDSYSSFFDKNVTAQINDPLLKTLKCAIVNSTNLNDNNTIIIPFIFQYQRGKFNYNSFQSFISGVFSVHDFTLYEPSYLAQVTKIETRDYARLDLKTNLILIKNETDKDPLRFCADLQFCSSK